MIDIFEKDWMSITLKLDARIDATKIYSLEFLDREFVDQEFNKLHDQDRMQFITQFTFFEWFVFVIWRTIEKIDEKKERVVMNIRDLNKIIVTNFYSLSLQFDITSLVFECNYIIVVDVADFFHQWRVKIFDRVKLTIVSHRDQEQFNVVAMRFKNFSSYVQRQIDNMLRSCRDYARVYVNDIVIFSKILSKHLNHLHSIFDLLDIKEITLSLKKSFLDYSTITLLDQKIDAFELTTIADKIVVIKRLKFSYKFSDLKLYLRLIDWLRDYVSFYAQKVESLQRRKILLLRMSPSNKGRLRKIYSQRIVLKSSINEELDFYRQLQKFFDRIDFLVHFDRSRTLYIDIDASKRRDFEVMIYHLKSDANALKSRRTNVKLILFLNRLLNFAKFRYWSTKLKMTDLVWMIKRVRHMIEAVAIKITIIFTDHAANSAIARQITLSSSSIDKFNLRLVRASIYLSQFNLNIKYRSKKEHIILDALSRLSATRSSNEVMNESSTLNLNIFHFDIENLELCDQIYVYQSILIAMSSKFRKRILDEYDKKKCWRSFQIILSSLKIHLAMKSSSQTIDFDNSNEKSLSKKFRIEIDFKLLDELIYYIDENDDRTRLCILKILKKEMFRLAHDESHHVEANRYFHRISNTLYISRLSKKIRTYVKHCSTCQVNQIKRHISYEELMSISTTSHSFHTIAMNFIVRLLEKYDCLLIVTDKFSRRLMLISRYVIDFAVFWSRKMLSRLQSTDWDIFETIISNRDFKFISNFWKKIFRQLELSLLMSTVYHSQTDELSERSNQTIEIAIRYLIICNLDLDWWLILSALQTQLNNSSNSTTRLSLNEIIYDFKIKNSLSLLHLDSIESMMNDITQRRLKYRVEAIDATAFANTKAKIYYDARYTSLLLNSDDKAYLRLNHDYQLSEKSNRKLSPQRCGSFLVKRRVERLTYELKISKNWKIHSVIFVAQLKSYSSIENLYSRLRSNHSNFVEIEDDISQWKSWEVERIVDKRFRKYDKKQMTQYQIHWKEYDLEHDVWRSIIKLDNCMKLIEEYESRMKTQRHFQNNHQSFSTRQRRIKISVSANNDFKSFKISIFVVDDSNSFIVINSIVLISSSSISSNIESRSTIIETSSISTSSRRRSERLRRWTIFMNTAHQRERWSFVHFDDILL